MMHEEDFIGLADALARKDKKQIMTIVNGLLSQGMNLLAIHSFMSRHIGLLLQARDAEEFLTGASDFRAFSKNFAGLKAHLDPAPIDKRRYWAHQKPFYAFNLSKTSRRFSEATLVSFLGMLADLDYKVKKGTRYDRMNLEAGLLEV
jgi:DNA polymerase III delta subunit